MTNLAHICETAVLVLVAYLVGCVLGYVAHRVLHAARGTGNVAATLVTAAPATTAPPARPRSPAARLAATASADEPAPLPAVASAKPESKSVEPKPAALAAPRGGQADNLKQIKGIGPKIETSLNAMGVYHLDQIARWTRANADWVDGQLAFKGRIRRERWVEQAIELSKVKA